MKKSIQTLANRLEMTDAGKIKGGFTSIKGGATSLSRLSTNQSDCNNPGTCSGSNDRVCTNGVDCSGSTNTPPEVCNNQQTCFSI